MTVTALTVKLSTTQLCGAVHCVNYWMKCYINSFSQSYI